MFKNAFIGTTVAPSEADLTRALGVAKPTWDALLKHLADAVGASVHEWKSYNPKKWGWSLRVLRQKRTIVWLSPGNRRFDVLFILGEKAVAGARAARLPPRIKVALATAPRYPEGTGLRFAVRSPRLLPALKTLAAIKVEH